MNTRLQFFSVFNWMMMRLPEELKLKLLHDSLQPVQRILASRL